MINRLRLIRNVGQFDSVAAGGQFPLARLTLVYAENGRGKTTLAAVLRSLASGDPIPITERHRLAANNPAHVILDCGGGPPAAIFENGAWNRRLPQVTIFDDTFVDENVYSGLGVEPDHRQHLHELILGAQGVSLNQELHRLVAKIEAHNAALRTKVAAIPAADRGRLTVDEFCGLQASAAIDEEIQAADRRLMAARAQAAIRDTPGFDPLGLPAFDIGAIERVLQADLPTLDTTAVASLRTHLAALNQGAEAWIAEGVRLAPPPVEGQPPGTCPFCEQDLAGSPVIDHYRAYFSDAYGALKRTVADALAILNHGHAGEEPASFERAVRVAGERKQFWSQFCATPDTDVDTAEIAQDWRAAREVVTATLVAKQAAPLERMALSADAHAALVAYEAHRLAIGALNRRLQDTGDAIRLVKAQAPTDDLTSLAAELERLRAIKARHDPVTAGLCDDYLTEKAAKVDTERERDEARAALDAYRAAAFPGYERTINRYLGRFNAEFRLDAVTATNTRGGPTCSYDIVINNTRVPVAGGAVAPGEPSFSNTLSAGDRNTLALAFFFASLDQDPALPHTIVVIDDPLSSLDDHRSMTTILEIRRLAAQALQVIVLSHNKRFLCQIWDGVDRAARTAVQISRDAAGSTIAAWDVSVDSATEHDRRHAILRAYVADGAPDLGEVARTIRPALEGFLRVAFPEHFQAGTLLGQFAARCRQTAGVPRPILCAADTEELEDLIEYSNRFHHDDENPAWQTPTINDAELRGFVVRTLAFATRPSA